jgi:hypothetical protein
MDIQSRNPHLHGGDFYSHPLPKIYFMDKATPMQLKLLKALIPQIEPEMVLPENLSKNMASNRINHLLKKKKDPRIKKKYMS